MILYAHRGDTSFHLENTRAAFDAALNRGFEALELDLLRTKDGRIVVYHDFWLYRLLGRIRRVRGITFDDFRGVFPALLSFEEFVERYGKKNLTINLEVKDDPETLRRIEPVLPGLKKPVISSFRMEVVHRAVSAGLEAGYLFDTEKDFLRGRSAMKTNRLHCSRLMLADSTRAHELYSGYEVHSYTVNDPLEAGRLAALSFVKGLFTDNPELLNVPAFRKRRSARPRRKSGSR